VEPCKAYCKGDLSSRRIGFKANTFTDCMDLLCILLDYASYHDIKLYQIDVKKLILKWFH
jgi:hypothetical protein